MMLVMEAADLRLAVKQVRLTSVKGVCPVLINTQGNEVVLSTDNLDTKVVTTAPALDGDLPDVLCPYDQIYQVLNKYPDGPIRVFMEDSRLHLEGERSSAKLFVFDPEAFPQRPTFKDDHQVDFSGVWDVVRRVASAADNSTVDWWRDLFFHKGYVYATDKYRVHRAEVPDFPMVSMRIPGPVVNAVISAKAPITTLSWDDHHFRLSAPGCSWLGVLARSEEVLKAAPAIALPFSRETTATFTVNRKELISALEAVLALVIKEEGQTFREVIGFFPDGDDLNLVRRAADVGERVEKIPYSSTGTLCPVGFNAHNLRDTLRLLEGDEVTFGGSENPRFPWQTGDGHLEAAIMPIKVD